MKNHMNSKVYDTFYIMKDINYRLNNPLDTRKAAMCEMRIKKSWFKPKISWNSICKFLSL